MRSFRQWVPPLVDWGTFLTKHIEKDSEDRYYSWLVNSSYTREQWLASFDGFPERPGFFVEYDGATPKHYAAELAVHRDDFPEETEFSPPAQDADPNVEHPTWWMLSFPDLDIHLCVERTGSVFDFTVDCDGQYVEVNIQLPAEAKVWRHFEAHRRRWADLYDHRLTDPDLDPAAATLATYLAPSSTSATRIERSTMNTDDRELSLTLLEQPLSPITFLAVPPQGPEDS